MNNKRVSANFLFRIIFSPGVIFCSITPHFFNPILKQFLVAGTVLNWDTALYCPVTPFSSLYHKMTYKLFEKQVEFHCQVLNILWHHFIVYIKSIDHTKLSLIFFFYNNVEKYEFTELALVSLEKVCMLHTSDIIFIVCTFRDNSYEPISMQKF